MTLRCGDYLTLPNVIIRVLIVKEGGREEVRARQGEKGSLVKAGLQMEGEGQQPRNMGSI